MRSQTARDVGGDGRPRPRWEGGAVALTLMIPLVAVRHFGCCSCSFLLLITNVRAKRVACLT